MVHSRFYPADDSKDALNAKLNGAVARKEKGDNERAAKAGATVNHAQQVARSSKEEEAQREEQAKARIAEKFTQAEKARDAEVPSFFCFCFCEDQKS